MIRQSADRKQVFQPLLQTPIFKCKPRISPKNLRQFQGKYKMRL